MATKVLDANAWVDGALAAILDGGLAAVAVEPLARSLGVTKGSFYWHFRDRDALLGALVDRWVARTDELLAGVKGVASPAARVEALVVAVHGSPEGVRALRAMGTLAAHPALGARVKAEAARRQAFLLAGFKEMGLDARRAKAAARLVHAATLGVGELDALGIGPGTADDRAAYVEALVGVVRSAAKQTKADTRRA